MFYLDENGYVIDKRTELNDAFEDIYYKLGDMTPEKRIAWFKSCMYGEPLKYTQEIDNTTYIVRTSFNENSNNNLLDKIEKIVVENN
ncbi:MAG: transposon-encoded TnpW family protein [Ruminococcus sp.]|nr:transposon-encoded TnpW family protein [Ruminococcus sp.]